VRDLADFLDEDEGERSLETGRRRELGTLPTGGRASVENEPRKTLSEARIVEKRSETNPKANGTNINANPEATDSVSVQRRGMST